MSGRDIKKLLLLAAVAALLLAALGGWAWVVIQTLKNEREVVQAELQTQGRERLDLLASKLESNLKQARQDLISSFESTEDTQNWYADQLESEAPSGLILPPPPPQPTPIPASLASWKARASQGIDESFAHDLTAAIKDGSLPWSIDRNGRDPVAFLAIAAADQAAHPELTELLLDRATDASVPLKPAFRLFLLKRLPNTRADSQKLLHAESLRASDGEVPAYFSEAEIITLPTGRGDLISYWTPTDFESLVGGFPANIHLTSAEKNSTYLRRISGLTQRPFLTIDDPTAALFSKTQRLLGTIGIASGLVLAAIVMGAILFARQQHRLALTRTDLAAAVAHELRTPLAGQRLVLESLTTGKSDAARTREYLDMALRENLRLSRLAEEFLTFSRLERGALQLESKAIDLRQVIIDATGPMRELLETCDFAVEVPAPVPVPGDSEALATVVRNLVENALKYSNSPAWIRVRSFTRDHEAIIEVEDHGQGIPTRSLKKVFRQFHRLDNSLARHNDGLGLGLTIVRRIVEAHRGRVELDSIPDKGSTFRIILPTEP